MPAPSIAALYDFESQLEGATQTILSTYFSTYYPDDEVDVTATRSLDLQTTPSVQIECSQGSPLSQMTTRGQATPKQVPNAFGS